MDEEAAILAAVAAQPADELPRLAYADWLDDHADHFPDPEAARLRAEFVRVQCEIGRVEHLPSPDLRRYVHLYRRQDDLLTNHRRDLLGPVADALGPHDVVFDRGFAAELRLDADRFARHAEAIAALRPRPDVTVGDIAANLAALSRVSGWTGLITVAEAQSARRADPAPLDANDVHDLFLESYPWDRLRELNLEGCGIRDDGLRMLVAAADHPDHGLYHPTLTHLDLSGNEISDDGVRLLVASPLWPRLTYLVLGANPISDAGAEALADAAGTGRLEYLNLKYTALTAAAHRLLFRKFTRRTKLDLF